jgi:8-oxo-dGTP pyrophosphatase MutT (NUDIX family)
MSRWRPSVTVAAVIERDGRFLFVEERADGRRVINQPAGHLDPGESLAAAVSREVLEETAHRFVPTALVGIYRWRYDKEDVTFLRFAFCGRIDGVEAARALDKEIIAAVWLAPAELAARRAEHRSPLVQQCVDDYLAGRSFPLEVLSNAYG